MNKLANKLICKKFKSKQKAKQIFIIYPMFTRDSTPKIGKHQLQHWVLK